MRIARKLLQEFPKRDTPQYLKVQWMEKNRIELENLLKKVSEKC
jgi:hypothetical protein